MPLYCKAHKNNNFAYIISFGYLQQPVFPKYQQGTNTEKLNNLLKVTQLVIIGASFQTLAQKAQIINSLILNCPPHHL